MRGQSRRPGVADVLTLGNALCGVAAIIVAGGSELTARFTMLERYQAAAMFLLFGTLFDVLDGAAARRWGGTVLGWTSGLARRCDQLRDRAGAGPSSLRTLGSLDGRSARGVRRRAGLCGCSARPSGRASWPNSMMI